jgi:hypothetical protein
VVLIAAGIRLTTSPRFQCRNRGADGGLGQIEHRRSARDVLTFSNGDEHP